MMAVSGTEPVSVQDLGISLNGAASADGIGWRPVSVDDLRECVDAARQQGVEQMQAIAHVYYAGNGGRSVTVDGDPSEASELLIVVKSASEYIVGMATPSEMFSDDGTVFIPSGATSYSQGFRSGFRYSGDTVMCLQALNIKYIIGVNQY